MACLDKIYNIMGVISLGMSAAAPPTMFENNKHYLGQCVTSATADPAKLT